MNIFEWVRVLWVGAEGVGASYSVLAARDWTEMGVLTGGEATMVLAVSATIGKG